MSRSITVGLALLFGALALADQLEPGPLRLAGVCFPEGPWGWPTAGLVFWLGVACAASFCSVRSDRDRIGSRAVIAALAAALFFGCLELGRIDALGLALGLPNPEGLWPNFRSPRTVALWAATGLGVVAAIDLSAPRGSPRLVRGLLGGAGALLGALCLIGIGSELGGSIRLYLGAILGGLAATLFIRSFSLRAAPLCFAAIAVAAFFDRGAVVGATCGALGTPIMLLVASAGLFVVVFAGLGGHADAREPVSNVAAAPQCAWWAFSGGLVGLTLGALVPWWMGSVNYPILVADTPFFGLGFAWPFLIIGALVVGGLFTGVGLRIGGSSE